MEVSPRLLIAIDAGHGGWDNGASFEGRLEKNDNLRLALAVQKQLEAQGVDVLMTRTTDVFVSLEDRARMANEAGADLFISLHRNSYPEHTPFSNGVENFIYLTASEYTAGAAAADVLNEVVEVGVQSNHGVSRGNYYVLRKTLMPSMLLEMGFIIDEIDNTLFDEHLEEYAAAIAKGALHFFIENYTPAPGVTLIPQPPLPPSPMGAANGSHIVRTVQEALAARYAQRLFASGVYDDDTRHAAVKALQYELNTTYNAKLEQNGIPDTQTWDAIRAYRVGSRGNLVLLLQYLLALNAYNPGGFDSKFGPKTQSALLAFQRDNYRLPNGTADAKTWSRLLTPPVRV